jgi:hypothetical protein
VRYDNKGLQLAAIAKGIPITTAKVTIKIAISSINSKTVFNQYLHSQLILISET